MTNANEVGLLSALEPDELVEFEKLGRRQDYRAGEIVMRQGDPSNFAILMREGFVRVVGSNPDGSQVVFALRGEGEILGEMAMLDGSPRSAGVEAATNVVCLVIKAQDLNSFLDRHPRIMRKLLVALAHRLRQATQQLRDVVGQTVDVRLAAILLDFADRFGTPLGRSVSISVGQQELADMVGASREAVVKALRVLRTQGLVETARRQLILHDLEQLRLIANPESVLGIFT